MFQNQVLTKGHGTKDVKLQIGRYHKKPHVQDPRQRKEEGLPCVLSVDERDFTPIPGEGLFPQQLLRGIEDTYLDEEADILEVLIGGVNLEALL